MLRLFGRSARAARLNRFGRIARIAVKLNHRPFVDPRLSQLPQLTLPALFMHPRVGYRARSGKCNRVEWYLYPLMGTICGPFTFDFDILWVLRKKTEWTSKLRMLADAAASARISVPRVQLGGVSVGGHDTTHLALAIPNGLNKSTRPDLNGFVGPCADSKPFPDQVEYIEFRDSLMNEPPLYEWLKNSVVRQLKRGQNVQALRQRNAEYIGVKVAMAILIIILVLSYVELLTEDTSLSWGFERLNAYVKLTIGTEAANQGRSAPEFNSTIPMAIRRQVITWGKQNEWGRPDRPLLYLDLQRQVYCNSLRPNGVSCSSPLSETTLWQQRKTLNEVDQDVSASPYRTSDLLLLRYPEFSQQESDVDISAEELENQTEAVESITRLQLAATTNADDENQPATSEIRLLRRRFNGMKTAIRSWGKYVPWPVVQLMMRKDAEANIEVSERQVTMFFSDIASFTTIVESIPPEKSLLMLSRYFQEMSKIVDQHGGIVVEFIGDAILCIYGAPVVNDKHATVAVMAAAEMLAAMTGINQWLTRRDLPKIAIRCGIHTGEVLVGNMGMQYRIKYGIVGDECSMPGRLEELNKTYGTQLLVSESTHSDMEIDGFVSRPIDFIRGSEETHDKESQQIFEVWKSNKKQSKAALEEKAADLYTEAVQHYRHKRFSEEPWLPQGL
ncbi:unnamed protein product [Durusdinium trenchii]|uniref:Guanylate cyclase domain-containing protein n=1 Tax=Durusdinium trenchii TaxID=1381693 RepID=A0ABP0JT72_9DINO